MNLKNSVPYTVYPMMFQTNTFLHVFITELSLAESVLLIFLEFQTSQASPKWYYDYKIH